MHNNSNSTNLHKLNGRGSLAHIYPYQYMEHILRTGLGELQLAKWNYLAWEYFLVALQRKPDQIHE